MRKVAVIASASGNGKTTVGRELAARLGVQFVDLDALVHRSGWRETSDAELRELIAPILESDAWVIDGHYIRKLGLTVIEAADTIVWLDLPTRVWLPRLLRRTLRRLFRREQLWNGNQETLRGAFWGRESLFGYAVTHQHRRRRQLPGLLAGFPVVRLRTTTDVEHFMADPRKWLGQSGHPDRRSVASRSQARKAESDG